VVALGPLTTVAAALAAEPGVAGALGDVVAMGGRYLGAPDAEPEFNARTDPWAARAVLAAVTRTWCVSLEVTSRMALTPADLDRLAGGGDVARYLAEQARARLQVLAADGVTACPMHDPLAVLAVTHPHLLRWHAAEVTVDTERPHRGRSRVHLLNDGAAHLATCRVAIDVDAAAAKDVLITRLAGLP
jgi:purine nucleosidase